MRTSLMPPLAGLLCCLSVAQTVAAAADTGRDPIGPVRLQTIELGGFWKQQAKRLTEKWLPHCIRQMEKGGRGQELMNLVALGRVQRGEAADWKYTGAPWSDAYVYNTVEAICVALAVKPGGDADLAKAQAVLRAKLEEWIPIILAAQAPDGYIHSFHVLNNHPRYSNVGWHEFYVMGYFLEMGVAHHRMTGGKDRRLYDAAVRCGDHLCDTFGTPPKRTWRNGHPGMEYALCRLGRLVNEVEGAGKGDKYIALARHFLDHQHEGDKGNEYNQSDKPAIELAEAKGHAVRATYFYTAMADIALHEGDAAYRQAGDRIWSNAIHKKHYLTGGVGAAHKGEAFGGDYELPNDAYCESCAGCGLSFWSDRMHRLHADGHYRDVQERALYNNILGSVELGGTNFYYQNPLDEKRARYPWHVCPCCVGNIPRALLAIKDLIYSVNPARTELYLSHYVDSEATLPNIGGAALRIRQETRYPWGGDVAVTLHPTRAASFTLRLRIPDRTESELYTATPDLGGRFTVRVNGRPESPQVERGYIALRGEWKDGDRVELSLPMEIQRIRADSRIAANVGRVALQYGPLVYNVESVDLPPGKDLEALALAPDAPLRAEWDGKLLGGALVIRGAFADGTPLQAIPNFTRMNRIEQRKSEWIHLANTYEGTTQRVYVNGKLAKSRQPGVLRIADTPLTIGSDPFGQKRNFKGAIAKPAIFNAALDERSIAQLAAARPDTASLGVATNPVFAGGDYALDGTAPVVTPQDIGISGNAPWTMSAWVKPDADAWSGDSFGMGIVGWGKSGRDAGNFLYYRPEGEAVFGFYGNDDRAPAGAFAANRSIVWLRENETAGPKGVAVPVSAAPFDLRDVKLIDGPFKDAQERDKGYILRVEPERLMHWWRVNNGLPSTAQPYGQWKASDYGFQGHYEGHFLSACAEMYRNTGDARFKERLDAVVAIIAGVQAKAGSGFIAPFPEKWLRIMAGLEPRPEGLGRLPVPWYALHKVYQGLIDANALAGSQQALDVMMKVAAWLEKYSAQVSDEAFQAMLDHEHGGINEALANLYAITRNPAHLALARRFCHGKVMAPLSRNEDTLDWLHANTQVPKFTGFARIYEFTGEPEYRDAARNFWRYVVRERSYANGGNSNHEKFTPKAHLSLSLSKGNAETCNTHNMLKLTRHLFAWEPSAAVADYCERAQINHILSSQHPKFGTVAYFHGMESGSRKGFSPGWVSLACCHGSGMENHAKYADSIYFHRGGERLFVSLFIASELNWCEAGLVLRQVTRFPEEAGTSMEIVAAKPGKATISIRRPAWVTADFSVTVNGSAVPTKTGPEGYVDLLRSWKAGDKISVALPMALRWEGFRDNPDRAALMYGPVMLVAKTDDGARHAVARKPADQALAAIKPLDKPLHFAGDPSIFRRDLLPKPVEFLPLYQEYQDAYIAYWDLRDDAQLAAERAAYGAEAKRWKELAPRTVDMVFFGAGTQSAASTMPGRLESDPALPRTAGANRGEKDHGLEAASGYNHEFNELPRLIAGRWQTFRTAEVGGDRFGWTLAVEPDKAQTLLIRLWSPPAGDPDAHRGPRCGFEVQAASVKAEAADAKEAQETEAATPGNQLDVGAKAKALPPLTTLGDIGPAKADGTFRDVAFPIPAPLVAGKDRLVVRLVRQRGKVGGLVAEARVLRAGEANR